MLERYSPLRRHRQGRQGEGVAFYVKVGLECVALAAGDDKVETLCVKMKGKKTKEDTGRADFRVQKELLSKVL